MNIMIAGASGAVGRLLVPRLVQGGHTVKGTTHRPENKQIIESMGAKALIADVFDREATFAAVRESRPEVVIHQLTSLGSRAFSENSRIRVEGTRHLVDAAREAGVKRIIVQSIAWAYQPGDGPATENVPLDVESANPSRKRTVDAVAALENTAAEIPEHVILRYGLFYGPGTWYTSGGYMAEEALEGRLSGNDGFSSFVHVEDAALAACQALDWPSGAYNIVDDEPARGTEWLPGFAESVGATTPQTAAGEGQPWERGATNAKARGLGWKPLYPTWRTGFGGKY
ncbi:NAD(P)-dependent oxidoreductase [Paenibacillus sp. XY044]|uniref:NAD-dependent epimerase/dehydratase family protein n=1 Tax=Paenibacillus sp. XY044 TaxID=2026089 RepID=UPI000B998FBF|nr:NAD(P)-dependent oxidoreductase [Paenibacillus sp. XY044]OZB95283.1 dTDP-glucose 4,6-dehydratase [Paenibacillus sp. XY044]